MDTAQNPELSWGAMTPWVSCRIPVGVYPRSLKHILQNLHNSLYYSFQVITNIPQHPPEYLKICSRILQDVLQDPAAYLKISLSILRDIARNPCRSSRISKEIREEPQAGMSSDILEDAQRHSEKSPSVLQDALALRYRFSVLWNILEDPSASSMIS